MAIANGRSETVNSPGMEHLKKLQAEANDYGFHKILKAWVDDRSSVARVLRDMDERDA